MCSCMTEDLKDGLGERVVTHSLGCPEHPEYVVPDLNNYASTIETVFRELANLYDDKPGKFENRLAVAERILTLLDADTAAEIIETAQRVG